MNEKQINRLLTLAEKFYRSYDRMVVVMEKRLEAEHPPVGEMVDAQVVRVGEGNAEQPQSKEEYDEFPIDQPTTFEKVIAELKARSQGGSS